MQTETQRVRAIETFACEGYHAIRTGEIFDRDYPPVVSHPEYFEPVEPGAKSDFVPLTIEQAEQRFGTLLEVEEAAAILSISAESVRRRLRKNTLPGVKLGTGPRAKWRVVKRSLDRQMADEARAARIRESGLVVGYGDEEFDRRLEARHGADTVDALRKVRERHALLHEAAQAVAGDPDLRRAFEQLDDDERIEKAAQEIAGRVRRQERIRRRAAQILAADDDDHHA